MKKLMVPLAVAAVMALGTAGPAGAAPARCGTGGAPAVWETVNTPGSPAVYGLVEHPAVPAVTEQVMVSGAWTETVEHPAVTHEEERLVREAWTEPVYETVEIKPAWDEQVLVEPAWTETVEHPAEYETVHHDAVTDRVNHVWTGGPSDDAPPVDSDYWHPANGEFNGKPFQQPDGVPYRVGGGNGDWFLWMVVVVEEPWDEQVLVKEAWTELVEHEAVYQAVHHPAETEQRQTGVIEHPAEYEAVLVVDEEPWTELVEHPAVWEAVVVAPEVPAWKEQVLLEPAVAPSSEEALVSPAVEAGPACAGPVSSARELPATGAPASLGAVGALGLASALSGAALLLLGRRRRKAVA